MMPLVKTEIIDRKYEIDGQILPSVTDILRSAGIIPLDVGNDEAMARGTFVHEATAIMDKGLELEEVPEEYEPFIRAYMKFMSSSGAEPVLIEQPVYNALYRYAGTLDRLYLINGERWVADIKTGSVPDWAPIQLAAYASCLEPPTWKRVAINLREDGSYKVISYPARTWHSDMDVFLSAMRIHQWKNR